MIISHDDYLTYELLNGWCAEENEGNLIIYDPNGEGALTVSFFTAFMPTGTLDRYLSIMQKNLLIKIKSNFIILLLFTVQTRQKLHYLVPEWSPIIGLLNSGLLLNIRKSSPQHITVKKLHAR